MSQLIINQIQKNTQSCINLTRELNELKLISGDSTKLNQPQDIIKKIKFFDEEMNKINFNLEEINTKLEYIMHYIDTNKLSTQPDFNPI
tara:strand:- start:220 stop:486 length:267 start_codon:yes stop_codon:yes gene_type:complete